MRHGNAKITNMHLAKTAILYIRQSTVRQVYENNESTLRQYALKDRLFALGWPADRIVTIDQDIGKSGAESKNRDGFQTLVADVSNNLVGAVACIECSRLSRSSADWSRLTQFCAYTNTLLIDTDGIYDPNDFNDRLLLGLKGTMNEAELHLLKERMRGGSMNKAMRGELEKPIPTGYLYIDGRPAKDPDMEVQNAVNLLFSAFRRTGSAHGVVRWFKTNGYKFPCKDGQGYRNCDVEWRELNYAHVLCSLHNPFYAGVYAYGEKQTVWTQDGKKQKAMPRESWHVFIKDHHEAYISFEEFEANQMIIDGNRTNREGLGKGTPPREGPALIQGLVWCGKCGKRMSVQYALRDGVRTPVYTCARDFNDNCGNQCQYIQGEAVDDKIADLLISKLTPEAVAQAVAARDELERRRGETLNFFKMRVEKCKYEAELARRRYMNVDPDNRLVALELESAWNARLKDLDDARAEHDSKKESVGLGAKLCDYTALDRISENFAKMFKSPDVSNKDKKRMARCLVEDVHLLREGRNVTIQIRYKGHATETAVVEMPQRTCDIWRADHTVVSMIREAAKTMIEEDIAAMLNDKGIATGKGNSFTAPIVKHIMYNHSIPTMKAHYLARGYISTAEKASSMGITAAGLSWQLRTGRYEGERVLVNAHNEYVFPPGQ